MDENAKHWTVTVSMTLEDQNSVIEESLAKSTTRHNIHYQVNTIFFLRTTIENHLISYFDGSSSHPAACRWHLDVNG